MRGSIFSIAVFGSIIIAGCDSKPVSQAKGTAGSAAVAIATPSNEAAIERAKLSAEDRALVEAQEWCVNSDDERLGAMGAPIKLSIKGQPVFVCCAGCKKSVEADPDKTLAKLAELKAKVKAEKDAKK